jgi:hypothetical protein
MKPRKHSLLLFAFIIVIFSCNQTTSNEGIIIVQDLPADRWEPEIDIESHEPGNVEIYRGNPGEQVYVIVYYHDISGKLRDYYFYQFDSVNYNQGYYNWKDDTTVTVRLYNSETKQEFNVELYPTRDMNSSGGARILD